MQTDDVSDGRGDSVATLIAVGVLAYVGETLGHELLGHGGLCLASGGRLTTLAPLWMRCSVTTVPMVLAGPMFNLLAAGAFAAALRLRRSLGAVGLFLWLSCAFNLLVACGYMVVGGAAGFGDWPFVFAAVQPAWAWRTALVVVGVGGYLVGLGLLARLYGRLADRRRLARRALLASAGAAVVAVAAELAGGRWQVGPLALALGCTLVVGWSLSRLAEPRPADLPHATEAVLGLRPGWVAVAAIVAAAFVLLVGPAPIFSP